MIFLEYSQYWILGIVDFNLKVNKFAYFYFLL